MRIALDAFGTDNRPVPDVAGAVMAARELNVTMILVGDEARVREELSKHDTNGLAIEVVHAEEVIGMAEKPSEVIKSKPRSSLHVGMELVKNGEADAFATMGNTGATLAIATVDKLRRIRGVKRPALTALFPFPNRIVTFLDVGANAECRPEWIAQFGVMGDIYAKTVMHVDNPRVAMVGTGDDIVESPFIQETDALLKQMPINYVGLITPDRLPEDICDVAVIDGFRGNILLKTFEHSLSHAGKILRQELRRNVRSMIGGAILRPALSRLRSQISVSEYVGAFLLGVNGVVLVSHGSSTPEDIRTVIRTAMLAVERNMVTAIGDGLQQIS